MHRALVAIVFIGLGCRAAGSGSKAPAEGVLTASWKDSTGTVQWRAPAEARWCARDTMLELIATRRDTAFGFVLYARDSLRVEGYPVFQAGVFAPWRPQAAAGLRVPAQAGLLGYESAWGRIEVSAAGPAGVSGTLDLHLKYSSGSDSLHLTGSFTRVAVQPDSGFCGRANKPAPG